jgi:spermidine/putrescine transport system ATP-binding protein
MSPDQDTASATANPSASAEATVPSTSDRNAPSLLTLSGVSKHFGDLVAVDDISFDIRDSEFIAILGPSGSGKSTILRMVAGFETPTEGDITIRSESVVDTPSFERDVNMVFQHLALFPHLTVEENITYGLKNKGVPKDEREERIDRMLEMVRLEGYNDRDPTELSGGEQQRVALARAVVNEPEIVLFDEPLASLDRKLRQHMQVELQRIQAETEITFLYVTHDQEVAMSVADRLVLLNKAQIEQVGTAEDLYETPNNRFVAEFIGDINTVETTVDRVDGDDLTVAAEGHEFTSDREDLHLPDHTLTAGEHIDMCIRPHALDLVKRGTGDHSFRIAGEVETRIYQGQFITYHVPTDLGRLTVTTDTETFRIGDSVDAVWTVEGTHFFPGEG